MSTSTVPNSGKVRVVLIRHCARDHDAASDTDAGLSEDGRAEAALLADALRHAGYRPTRYLTSRFKHADETARELMQALDDPPVHVDPADALTPHCDASGIATLYPSMKLHAGAIVALVGHEPRLGQLYAEMTGDRRAPLRRGQAVCLEGEPGDAIAGRMRETCCVPTDPYGPPSAFQTKLTSKLTVSSVLAGFTGAALVELLTSEKPEGLQYAGMTLLGLALCLFIAAIYTYDELAMPAGYWVSSGRGDTYSKAQLDEHRQWRRHTSPWRRRVRSPSRRRLDRELNRRAHGPVYAEMVAAWDAFFTLAVWAAALGFVALSAALSTVFAVVLATTMATVAYYWHSVRPTLAVD